MANISITDLQLAGSGLFSDAESFIDSMQDLSEDELKMTFGGKNNGSKSKSKQSKSKHSKSNSYSYYPHPGGGGTGGGGTGGN